MLKPRLCGAYTIHTVPGGPAGSACFSHSTHPLMKNMSNVAPGFGTEHCAVAWSEPVKSTEFTPYWRNREK